MANAFLHALPGEKPAFPAGAGGASAPSVPAAPATPPIVVAQAPAPVPALPVSADPNIPSLVEQGGRATGGTPYFLGYGERRTGFEPKPIAPLSQSVPGDAELASLLGGKVSGPKGFEPARGQEQAWTVMRPPS